MTAEIPRTDWIWNDGTFVPWDDARIHVMTHALHYGSSIFEGIRFYETPDGPAVMRLRDHIRRFYTSCRIYNMEPAYSPDELSEACMELIRRNGISEGYLRPLAFRGVGALGLNPKPSPIQTLLICWPWGRYLGAEALDQGVDACVSSWSRPAPNTHPSLAKAGGNYINSQLIKMEALANGFSEAIALGPGGTVSEGSGQNIFLVVEGELLTPALDGTLLAGITRNCVLRMARDMGMTVKECTIPREMLYQAEEIFFAGTASEITPVRSVDRIPVGDGGCGPVTRRLQEAYLAVARGIEPDPYGWLERVRMPAAVAGD